MRGFLIRGQSGAVKGRSLKYVLFYESADDAHSLALLHYPAHRARFEEYHARGVLVMLGSFVDSPEDGAMAVFTTREAAESFASADPFVLHGIVRSWRIRAWNEVVTGLDGAGESSG